jgi:hypothetical protein
VTVLTLTQRNTALRDDGFAWHSVTKASASKSLSSSEISQVNSGATWFLFLEGVEVGVGLVVG